MSARRAAAHPKPPAPLERKEQAAIVRWLDVCVGEYGFFHVPNAGKRGKIGGAQAKRQGLRAGVPDLIAPEARGVAIEMKRRAGGVERETQSNWLAALKRDGWLVCTARGWDEARTFLESLGFGPHRRIT